ncbi:hypothetical protein A2U01_0029314, partial [Trifolium medium]|nr:hypothetical protein [Trifolium medium]
MRAPIPLGFKKPPPLGTYDGKTDPDDHVDNINAILDFRRAVEPSGDLTEQFRRHFTASRRHPKTVATFDAIYQGQDESLRNYIERFNKEVVQVNTTDDMKHYLLERGLRPHSDFAKAVGIEKPQTLDELLAKAQPYISTRSARLPTLFDIPEQKTIRLVGSQIPLPGSLPAEREARRRVISTGSPEDHPTCSR